MKKMKLGTILFFVSLLVLTSCSKNDVNVSSDEEKQQELEVMTMEMVMENDGQDGRNAYIVVEGIVYDVTNSPRWRDGQHNGFQAGNDLTNEILKESPHGTRVLNNIEAVGRIDE